ncbi:tetratricopeptide repeat protein 9C-like [Ptychodera flava]|uniref:tetratricopeptide repeat protein 9C-like n=1 Tax=Ptychodera flava TaxID=63121 RepID=UPI00396A3B2E
MAEGGDVTDNIKGNESLAMKTKMSISDRISTAENYKQDGNKCYKEKKYRAAIGKYHRGLLYLRELEDQRNRVASLIGGIPESDGSNVTGLSEEQKQEASKVRMDLYNNLAACLLQVSNPNYEKIIHYCDCVLSQQPDNVKALYRRGMALYHTKAYDDSRDCLLQAKGLCTGKIDPNIKRYLEMCKEAIAKHEAQEKSIYRGMFDKFAEDKQE